MAQTFAVAFIALYLGVGIGFCVWMRSEKAPGHWTNYPMLILGWPIIILVYVRQTHSLMYAEGYGNRSYFYRTHRTCDDASSTGMDGFILDMIKRNGD